MSAIKSRCAARRAERRSVTSYGLQCGRCSHQAQLSKFVHEKADAGPRRADHLRERLLADFCNDRLRLALLAKIRQQQEQPGKPLLTRIEQLIHEVFVDAGRQSS